MSAVHVPERRASLRHEPPAAPRPGVITRPWRRRPARRRPFVVDLLAAAAGLGLGITIGLVVSAESAGSLAATAASAFLFTAGISSYRLAKRRMTYETWWSVHLYTYLALLLSFSHLIDTGASFVGDPVARVCGPRSGSARSASSSSRASGCRCGARCATGSGWWA